MPRNRGVVRAFDSVLRERAAKPTTLLTFGAVVGAQQSFGEVTGRAIFAARAWAIAAMDYLPLHPVTF